MKLCFIFRGDNLRNESMQKSNALANFPNWQETLFANLNRDDYDIIFITYESEILEDLKKLMNPVYVSLTPAIDSNHKMKEVAEYIIENQSKYDRFIICRFDVLYKIPILKWNKWNEFGIILTNRDVHWYDQFLYADCLFIVDSGFSKIFYDAILYCYNRPSSAHEIGQYLTKNNIKFHTMYDGFYHNKGHPFYGRLVYSDPENPQYFTLDTVKDKVVIELDTTTVLSYNKTFSQYLSKYAHKLSECILVINTRDDLYSKDSEIKWIKLHFTTLYIRSDFQEEIKSIYPDCRFDTPINTDIPTLYLNSFQITNEYSYLIESLKNITDYTNLLESLKITPITYIAAGHLGDFIQELSVIAEIYYETGRKGMLYLSNKNSFRFGLERAFQDTYEFVKNQVYIEDYKIWNNESYDIDLNVWRDSPLLYKANWQKIFQDKYSVNWGKHKWIDVPINPIFSNSILVNVPCYREFSENINYKKLFEIYGDNLLFISFDQADYHRFIIHYQITIPCYTPSTLYDMVVSIASCKLFIGELSAPLAIAFSLHKNSIIPLPSSMPDWIHNAEFDKFWPHVSYSVN